VARYFLVGLDIEGFRGINNEGDPLKLSFRADRVNSLFAPNAQGKSSIFEALCYAVHGYVPKLRDLPAAERSSEYYANRFHQGGTATVVLSLAPDDGGPEIQARVSRLADGTRVVDSPSGHTDPDGLLRSLDTEACLVDQRTFLRFVEDTPLERGRSFARLLGLGQLSEHRQALETLAHRRTLNADLEITTLEGQVRGAQDGVRAAEDRLRRESLALLNKTVGSPIDFRALAIEVGVALAQAEPLKPLLDDPDIRRVQWPRMREAVRQAEQGDKQATLVETIREIGSLEALASTPADEGLQRTLRQAADARDQALLRTQGPRLQKLYEIVWEILESGEWHDPNECPACNSRLAEPLKGHVDRHLAQYREVVERSAEIRASWASSPWVRRLRSLSDSPHLPLEKREPTEFATIAERASAGTASAEDIDAAVALAGTLEVERARAIEERTARRDQLRAELPPSLVALTEQVGHAEQLAHAIADCGTGLQREQDLARRLEARTTWANFIQGAAEGFAEAEVRLSTAITQTLATQYQTLYGTITNNPEIVPILEKSSGSEDLRLVLKRFYGLPNLSASTLLAESYRNALAIAIFFSAALRDRGPARFIVMDDVTSSFDAGHQFALMEVLRTSIARPANPDGPQLILLSHDGLLEKYFDRLSSEAQWHHQRIQGMPPRGNVLTQAQNANRHRSTAEHFLRAGQVEQGEPLVRQYLEFKLQQVIRKVNIQVPFDFAVRDDRKQVQTCLDAITTAVDLYRGAGRLVLEPAQVTALHTQHVPALLGNWLSHYATGITASLSPHVLLGVLDTIDHLAECFTYECRCDGTPRRRFYRDLSTKDCGC